MWRHAMLLGLFLGLLGACGSGMSTTVPASTGTSVVGLTAGDKFAVRVYGEEDLTGEYQVADDGTIDFPLVGRVEVKGMEPGEVQESLTALLKDGEYLKDPQITVTVIEYSSRKFTVIGAVKKPGNFPLTPGVTVVQAISLAGGFTALADRGETVVTRVVDGKSRRFKVDVDDVTKAKSDDVAVEAGDIISVPERIF